MAPDEAQRLPLRSAVYRKVESRGALLFLLSSLKETILLSSAVSDYDTFP